MSVNFTSVGEVSRDFTKSQGSVRKCQRKKRVRKNCLKLFSCIYASILDIAEIVHFIIVSDFAMFHSYPHH